MHSAVFAVVRCPSVRLSVTYAGIVSKRLNLSLNFFDLLVAPSIVFDHLRRYPIPRDPFSGALNTRGGENLRFSTEIAVYLAIGTRDANGCYVTIIGSHMADRSVSVPMTLRDL